MTDNDGHLEGIISKMELREMQKVQYIPYTDIESVIYINQ